MHHFQSRPCSLLRTVSLCPRSAEDAGVASWEGRSRERKGPGSLSDRVEQSTLGQQSGAVSCLWAEPRDLVLPARLWVCSGRHSCTHTPARVTDQGWGEGRRSVEPPKAGWASSAGTL